jgi:putative Mn2+ efflux pump MntP
MVALLVVAVALGLNNFGAAIAIGVSGVDRRTEIKVATVFGLCDVVMPATGMLIGTGLAGPLGAAARWAGAGILFATAVWGLIEALRGGDDAPQAWHGWRLLVSGAALSLDDLAVGLALGTVRYSIVLAVTLFGLMSFVMSIIGLKLGGKLGTATGEHGEIVGAIVLAGIAGAMAMGWLLPAVTTASAATGSRAGRTSSPRLPLAHGRDAERVADPAAELGDDARGYVADLADELAADQTTANCLHPATFMDTAMVTLGGITPVSTVEEGGEATMRLITDPALDAVTGQFFDGPKTSRALPQAYDQQFRTQLREVTDRMLSQAA